MELISQAVALRPNVPAFHANLAEAYRASGQLERAVGCCRAALQLWPDYPEALCNLGVALQGLERSAEAIEPLKRALGLRPNFATAQNNLGIALRDLGQRDEALEAFRRAVELEPAFAPARTNLGQMLLDLGHAEEALPHCQEAVRLAPDLPALHHNLGNVLRGMDRLVEARAAYLEALRLDPKLALAQAHLGLILQKEGQLDNALVWLKQAVALEPANATFWERLAELQDEREEPGEAIPCWERVLALATEERPGPHLSLGWAFQEEGRLIEAGEHYRTAAALNPELAGRSSTWEDFMKSSARWPRPRRPSARCFGSSRTTPRPTPGWPPCCVPGCPTPTSVPWKSGWPTRSSIRRRAAGSCSLWRMSSTPAANTPAPRTVSARPTPRPSSKTRAGANTPADHEQFVDRLLQAFSADWFTKVRGSGLETRGRSSSSACRGRARP